MTTGRFMQGALFALAGVALLWLVAAMQVSWNPTAAMAASKSPSPHGCATPDALNGIASGLVDVHGSVKELLATERQLVDRVAELTSRSAGHAAVHSSSNGMPETPKHGVLEPKLAIPEQCKPRAGHRRAMPAPIVEQCRLEFYKRDFKRKECLRHARNRLVKALVEEIDGATKSALVDLPTHRNWGDEFITAGEERALAWAGMRHRIACGFSQQHDYIPRCDPDEVAQLVNKREGVVFFQGGGNWGNLYRATTTMRLTFMKQLADLGVGKIVMFSQSLLYKGEEKDAQVKADAASLAAVSATGTNVTLFWRQQDSYEFAKKHFPSVHHRAVPDAAFGIGPAERSHEPRKDILFLLRSDKESKPSGKEVRAEVDKALSAAKQRFDSDFTYEFIGSYNKKYAALKELNDGPDDISPHGMWFGEVRVALATSLFSRGRVIVSNRLHTTVLATLLGIPCVYLDNSYRKVSGTRLLSLAAPECTNENLHAVMARTPTGAVNLAVDLARSALYP